MRLITHNTHFDFIGKRKAALIFSTTLIVLALLSVGVRGLNFGIDFTGGTLIEVSFPNSVDLSAVRQSLGKAGFEQAVVQHFGSTRDVLVRIAPREGVSKAELSSDALRALGDAHQGKINLRRVEFVGPQVGRELTESGGLAMLVALGGILIYVGLRFEYRFALGAVAALIHDVIITIGFFSELGLEFDLTTLAAVLAVIGYSLNDTIVVFDRVRENFRRMRKGSPELIVNASINQTLSRTLMTSLTTLIVVVALFLLGGDLIHSFSTALIVGIVIGTYSSIYVASTAALALGISKQDMMPVKKEGEALDARP